MEARIAAGEGLTARLASAAVRYALPSGLHDEVIAHAWTDTIAVSLAAVDQEGMRALRRAVIGERQTAAWLSGGAVRADDAALLNGTAAHYLDFDDVSPSMPMHPSAVLVPALMAAAERDGTLRFDAFARAYNVGAAMFRLIAEALPSARHYGAGWHSTSTVGRLAAVAAIARLRNLTPELTANALAMASSMASGSRANFGTMTKPMHAGLAARDAVNAIDWSTAGVDASATELEAPSGFFRRFGDPDRIAWALENLDARLAWWVQEWPADWGLKRHPSCYATHRSIDAALDLREHASSADIEWIDVEVYRGGTAPLILRRPESGTEAKFSLEHCIALAWLHGAVTMDDFTDEGFASADRVNELAGRVTVREVDGEGEFNHVTVTTRDGGSMRKTVAVAKGSGERPLQAADVRVKVQSCCEFAGVTGPAVARLLEGADGISAGTDLLGLVADLHAMPRREG